MDGAFSLPWSLFVVVSLSSLDASRAVFAAVTTFLAIVVCLSAISSQIHHAVFFDITFYFLSLSSFPDLRFFKQNYYLPLLCSAPSQRVVLSFAENKYLSDCAELWLDLFYQERWQCEFKLSKFPFEDLTCHMYLHLMDDQRWHPKLLSVIVPEMGHLPYLVRPPRDSSPSRYHSHCDIQPDSHIIVWIE